MKLKDWIHPHFPTNELSDQVRRYLDLEVVKEYQSYDRHESEQDEYRGRDFAFWMGPGQNVFSWVLLENGRGVGFNESPSVGWNYYILSKKKTANALDLSKNYWKA